MTPDRGTGVWRALPWPLRYAAASAGCALVIAAAVYLLLRLAVLVAPLTLAVIIGLLLTALLQPVTALVCRLGAPRSVGALAGVFVLLVVVVVPVLLMWQVVAQQAGELPGQLGQGWERTRDWLGGAFGVSDRQLDTAVDQAGEKVRKAVAPNAAAYAMGAVEAFGAALLSLVLVFFLLKDGPAIVTWSRGLLPAHSRDRWSEAAGNGWRALARYARGTVAVAAIDAVGIGAALLVIGVPLALPLTLLTFVAAFVPVLGATVAGVVATLVALAAGGPIDALLVLAAVIIVQQVEGNVLEPLIMGRALRLHPAVVLVAVTAGALTGGVAGAMVSVPVTAVAYQVTRTVLRRRDEPDAGHPDAGQPDAEQPDAGRPAAEDTPEHAAAKAGG
ncbi:AI-2E family transporter [Dactylosporangium sp. NBC_01737]|uniref:AI-2E family transporter n=1 Tax=Dactylosporangium sp. NBC_01737 TaxID=2975959 RepID=UPI002E0D8B05|nr:AI-2E family transporter [Dactylosporangium sp. NBC_01737]